MTTTRPEPPTARALALSGLLAGAAGLVVGEVLGRVVPGASSPVLAVADRVVDLAPTSLRQPAIEAFGSADKPLLIGGVLLVVAALAACGGRLAGRAPRAAAGLVVALSLVVLLAQLPEPDAGLLGAALVAATLAATTLAVLRMLVGLAPAAAPQGGVGRRRFLARSAAVGLAVVGAGGLLRSLAVRADVGAVREALDLPPPLRPAPGDVAAADLRVSGVAPVLTPNAEFYRIDTALLVPQVDPTTWSLRVEGLVDRPLVLRYDDLLAMRQVEADITISCVSNEVGGDLVGTARWQGVLLRDVLERAGLRAGAEQVVGRSVDGFTAGFPVRYATDGRLSMIALGMNGEPLPVRHGFPARLVVPGLYGYVSATKWLARLQVTTWAGFDGYWVPRGWSKEGPIKTSSRIDVPGREVDAGEVVVAGVAWAPGLRRGIAAVEVRVDGGPWQPAALGGALSEDTWRQWRWTWQATPGRHLLEVRATDGLGDVQTGEVVPIMPDGATGYHGVEVDVR
ncbi:MAG TPA: molybdopterin-dependent oxidoreductase [Mycobacteriales bacterium]|nr:molybdopterin-dependent oxidoreductase [Mycobacteriales bacterium]